MKFKLFKFGSISSTNDLAIYLIKKENKKCGCVIAELQTKGKGTYGKKWISKKGNLFGSFFFPLKKNYPNWVSSSVPSPRRLRTTLNSSENTWGLLSHIEIISLRR